MLTRRADTGRVWRSIAIALVVCLHTARVLAQVPDATVQRIAEINVQLAEIDYLWNSNQIEDHARTTRRAPLEEELGTLNQELRQFSPDEQRNAARQVQGLTQARLAILEPEWQRTIEARRREREQRDKTALAAVPAAARAALEPQRRRLILQQRRDRGEITAEEFAVEDKKALDEILAIRNKYIADYGPTWSRRFDTQLQVYTQALGN